MVPSSFAFVVNEHPSGILRFWALIESNVIVFVWFPLPSGSSNKWNTLKTTGEGTWYMTDYVHVHDCLLLWRLQKKHPLRPSNKTYHPYNNRMQPWNILTYPILSQTSLYHQPPKKCTINYYCMKENLTNIPEICSLIVPKMGTIMTPASNKHLISCSEMFWICRNIERWLNLSLP